MSVFPAIVSGWISDCNDTIQGQKREKYVSIMYWQKSHYAHPQSTTRTCANTTPTHDTHTRCIRQQAQVVLWSLVWRDINSCTSKSSVLVARLIFRTFSRPSLTVISFISQLTFLYTKLYCSSEVEITSTHLYEELAGTHLSALLHLFYINVSI